jgi:HD-GYP domain-containing protein (c-di-GMP phosphodiesterase class II)
MAMTQDRPYQAAIPREEALAELGRHAGTQFDAAIVATLLELERETLPSDAGVKAAGIEISTAA